MNDNDIRQILKDNNKYTDYLQTLKIINDMLKRITWSLQGKHGPFVSKEYLLEKSNVLSNWSSELVNILERLK